MRSVMLAGARRISEIIRNLIVPRFTLVRVFFGTVVQNQLVRRATISRSAETNSWGACGKTSSNISIFMLAERTHLLFLVTFAATILKVRPRYILNAAPLFAKDIGETLYYQAGIFSCKTQWWSDFQYIVGTPFAPNQYPMLP